MLLRKVLPTFQINRSNETIKKLQNIFKEQNELLIEENNSKTAIIEMLVES